MQVKGFDTLAGVVELDTQPVGLGVPVDAVHAALKTCIHGRAHRGLEVGALMPYRAFAVIAGQGGDFAVGFYRGVGFGDPFGDFAALFVEKRAGSAFIFDEVAGVEFFLEQGAFRRRISKP